MAYIRYAHEDDSGRLSDVYVYSMSGYDDVISVKLKKLESLPDSFKGSWDIERIEDVTIVLTYHNKLDRLISDLQFMSAHMVVPEIAFERLEDESKQRAFVQKHAPKIRNLPLPHELPIYNTAEPYETENLRPYAIRIAEDINKYLPTKLPSYWENDRYSAVYDILDDVIGLAIGDVGSRLFEINWYMDTIGAAARWATGKEIPEYDTVMLNGELHHVDEFCYELDDNGSWVLPEKYKQP